MSIIKFLRRLFKKKPAGPDATVITMNVVGGKQCPVCDAYGLFHYADYSRCEECLTEFDDKMNIVKEEKYEKPYLRYRDDGGTDGG